MYNDYHLGQTSIILVPKVRRTDTSQGLTGLTFASSGLRIAARADNEATTTAYTAAGGTIETVTTLGTYAAPTATKCRFREVDATNHPGDYELHLADARFAVAGAKSLRITLLGAANMAECDMLVPLRAVDPYDPVDFGLSALDTNVGSRMATYAQPTGFLTATFPASFLAAGAAMTLTAGERDAIAAAYLDLVNGIEPGETPRQWARKVRAVLMGLSSASGAFKRKDGTTTSVTVTPDGSGGRSASNDGTN
jgi:hypothetical protein